MSQPLDDADKARIRAEEVFRNEVRQVLTESPPTTERTFRWTAWAFLNSNFAIWLLSAIFVSFSGAVYTRYQNAELEEAKKRDVERAEHVARRELTDRLTLEISFRFSSTLSRLRSVSIRFGDEVSPESEEAIIQALEPLMLPSSDSQPPLFPEFKSYSGLALIAELRRHAPAGERERLRIILARASGVIYETIGETGRTPRSAKAVASLLLEHVRYSKWDNGFPYTDCHPQAPFC